MTLHLSSEQSARWNEGGWLSLVVYLHPADKYHRFTRRPL